MEDDSIKFVGFQHVGRDQIISKCCADEYREQPACATCRTQGKHLAPKMHGEPSKLPEDSLDEAESKNFVE